MIDEFLLEAMREVDAMLPDSPPIAPRPGGFYEVNCRPEDIRNAAGWNETKQTLNGVPIEQYMNRSRHNSIWSELRDQKTLAEATRRGNEVVGRIRGY